MRFVKMQATGNDFIVIDARERERNWAEVAVVMCDCHFGVGSDGLLLVLPSGIADLRMRVFNPDGSEAETCGNGLRCFAKHVIEKGLVEVGRQELTVETLAGIKKLRPYIEDGQVTKVQVSMGTPKLKAEDIPVVIERSRGILDITLPLCYTVTVTSRELPVRLISMGNPHAVCFVNEPVTDFPLPELGPEVECHPSFPRRINFEVANIVSRNQIAARVWERGAGETLSCGSGACAIAVAARLCDYVTSPVDIILPGGTLSVEWDGKGKVLLTGPVEEVFTGEWPKE